ncbi:hypothetical protein B0T21DRAFT_135581 [Apiosordaria backusii]|uniref:DUF676 domain-containing protein n=1 Tax=Apiosordaria backusii TaxID=314023 RepID=A0AA40BRD9_9PEZI|nr:hypothetical protein B0T21DRAFT_135581 [Apiosordaria backusii]
MSSSVSRLKRIFSLQRRDRVGATASTSTARDNRDLENFPHGLKVVVEGENPLVDIVAVHGLDGHRDRTWTADNQVNWLHDLLPHDIPHARVLCWGYDANTRSSDRVSCHYLYDHARTLVSELCQERKHSDSVERPIQFIAYSLGGIVVKSALIHSDATRRGALEEHRSIKISTYGIIFLGTPHQGANGVQLGKLLVNIASLFVPADDLVSTSGVFLVPECYFWLPKKPF